MVSKDVLFSFKSNIATTGDHDNDHLMIKDEQLSCIYTIAKTLPNLRASLKGTLRDSSQIRVAS